MSTEILLTIAIPTYNGSKYIRETIDSIISSLPNKNSEQIEILISDNASTDNTPEIIHEYSQKYPNLFSYHRNDTNIGYDGNVDAIFKKAKGKYIELLGDDDYLENDAISKILNILNQYDNLSVILLSSFFLNIQTNQKNRTPLFDQDVIYKNGDNFFKNSKWMSAAVSCLIIRKSEWDSNYLEKYKNTQWIHVGAIINILSKETLSYIISEPLLTIRIFNPRWEGHFGNKLQSGLTHLNILHDMLYQGYSKNTFSLFVKDRYNNNLRDIIDLKSNNFLTNLGTAQQMIRFFYAYPLFWLIHLPILLFFPISFLKKLKNYLGKS